MCQNADVDGPLVSMTCLAINGLLPESRVHIVLLMRGRTFGQRQESLLDSYISVLGHLSEKKLSIVRLDNERERIFDSCTCGPLVTTCMLN